MALYPIKLERFENAPTPLKFCILARVTVKILWWLWGTVVGIVAGKPPMRRRGGEGKPKSGTAAMIF